MTPDSKFSIFVSSSDSYSDLWPVFFELFQRMWPEYSGIIYLQTQEKAYSYPGLNIVCTNVGRIKDFGATLLAGLNKVEEGNILFFMIDYIFMGRVNNQKVQEYFDYFKRAGLDTLVLYPQPFQTTKPSSHRDLQVAVPPCNRRMFGFQTAFWRLSVLKDLILPHENPWMCEWYGSERAALMNIREESLKACLSMEAMPIPYDVRGCLHQGKWLDNAIEWIKIQGITVDFNNRGIYVDNKGYNSFSYKFKIKWIIWTTGLKGSWKDLTKRKPIH